MAVTVNNEAKGRQNLSVKSVNEGGELDGYLFAYEGKNEAGEQVIYVRDIAERPEAVYSHLRLRLIQRFVKTCKKAYGENVPKIIVNIPTGKPHTKEPFYDRKTQLQDALAVYGLHPAIVTTDEKW